MSVEREDNTFAYLNVRYKWKDVDKFPYGLGEDKDHS
jgi:hypothetical protein